MIEIKEVAPTIFDALKAVERGCRTIQNDPHFIPEMTAWLTILTNDRCMGCLATYTLMQLTGKTGKEVISHFPPVGYTAAPTQFFDRARAVGIVNENEDPNLGEFARFESAIDSLRNSELEPLLQFYNLEGHPNAKAAIDWVMWNHTDTLDSRTTKIDLLRYANFLRDRMIPKLQELLP